MTSTNFPLTHSLFPPAPQQEIIRSFQKDSSAINSFSEELSELASGLFGGSSSRWQSEIEALAELIFFTCTTLRGSKTLGEEYCDLEIVDHRGFLVSFHQRLLFVFFQVLAPYTLLKLRKVLRRAAVSPGAGGVSTIIVRAYNMAVDALRLTEPFVLQLNRFHLAAFYLFGFYFQLPRRLACLRYIYTRRVEADRPGYQMLGVLLSLQLAVLTADALRSACLLGLGWRRSPELIEAEEVSDVSTHAEDEAEEEAEAEGATCALCLARRKSPTVTECGHVFCWRCIAEWCTKKPECPLCRSPASLNKLVVLANFSE